MATNEAKVIISAEDKTKAGIQSAEKGFSSFAATAKKFAGPIAAIFATKEIISFGKSSVLAFAEAEAKMAVFDTTIKTLGKNGERMRDTLIKAADATTKLGFDNETVAAQMAKFAQITNDASQAIQLNQVAMDLARAKNIDYETAARSVQMVMAGNTRTLREMGIALTEGATPLENIAELQKVVAGQSEAFANTTSGSMETLSMVWGDFKETVGETLATAVTPFIKELTAFVTDPRFIEFMTTLSQVIGVTLKVAIWAVKAAFDGWYQIITSIWELLKLFGKWISDVFFYAIDGIRIGFDKVKSSIQAVIDVVTKLINKFKELNIVQGAKNVGSKIVSSIGNIFKADGGPVSANNPYIVGERGPELFVPNSSGSIVPNNRLAGAGNITINISGNTLLDGSAGEKLAAQIMRTLKQNLRI